MSKLNQKEAVFNAVKNVCGNVDGAYNPTKQQRADISAILVTGFQTGAIQLEKTFTESELKAYVSGLLSNWLRKDTRLNGGTKYEAKNPGSRAGAGDSSMKEMRKLLKVTTNPADRAEIEAEINKRAAEIAATKTKVSVNYDALPESLRSKYTK